MFQVRTLYSQVMAEIARRIEAGTWPTNAALPNEFALSMEFGVSIGTIRKAVEQLVNEGVLTRRQGRGTFVRDTRAPDRDDPLERIVGPDGAPVDWTWLPAEIALVEAAPREREALALRGAEALVWRIARERRAGGGAILRETCALPAARFTLREGMDSRETSLARLARAAGVAIGAVEETIRCGLASREDGDVQGLAPGEPVLRLERRVLDPAGRPLEWRVALCRPRDKVFRAISGHPAASTLALAGAA